MRIIYITERAPFGSGESFIITEVNQLRNDGHDIRICPLSNGELFHRNIAQPLVDCTEILSLGSPAVLFSVMCGMLRRPLRTAKAAWLLRRSASVKQLLRNILALLKGVHAAHVATRWRADHIHAHWANYTATSAMVASALSGIPWSFTAHRYDIVANNLLSDKLQRASFSRFIARSGLTLAAARNDAAAMSTSCVLHMGVPIRQGIGRPGESRSIPLFLCPAALIARKGHRYLIDAVAILRQRGVQLELWLVGDGPLRTQLHEQIQAANVIGSMRMLGPLPNEEVLNLYRTHDIAGVVLPSVDAGDGVPEGIPVSLMEAMSFGVPVVSTRTGGTPELLEDGAGILVPPEDSAALADAMQQLIERADFRERIGRSGRRRVEQDFDVGLVARRLASMFEAACPAAEFPCICPGENLPTEGGAALQENKVPSSASSHL